MKTSRALALLLTVPLSIVAAEPLTPEQTLDRRTIADLEFSPDGGQLVFTVADPPKGATRSRRLWLLDVATRQTRALTTADGKSDTSPRWSPDGRSIAFLGNREADHDTAQHLYLLSLVGGEPQRVVDIKEAITAFRWSPDGRTIAFLMPEPKPTALEQREKDRDDSRVVDKDERHPRIWLVDMASRFARQLTVGRRRFSQIEWMPDGRALVAAATEKPESDRWTEGIFTISLADANLEPLTAPKGPLGAFAVSPDGRTIAYVGARSDGPEPHDLWMKPAERPAYNVTGTAAADAEFDRPIRQIRWIDSSTVMAIADSGFHSSLMTATAKGSLRTIVPAEASVSAFARASNGTIAFVSETTAGAPEVWLRTGTDPAVKVTDLNAKWASIPVVAPQFVHYKSFDGTSIEAALLLPGGTSRPVASENASTTAARMPMIVLVHGGPTGRWSDTFEPWGQLLVARGYAVLYPNIRGSTGYGQHFVEMNRADWGGGDFKDVMSGVDWAIARGIADPDRLGIGGWSYGGYMAAWAVTQTTRFKAAVSGAPVIDLASEYGTEAGPAYDEWFYGLPYEKPEGFVRSSPITHVRRAKTPTLLLQGEDDVTDPIGQSQQFYRGLKRYGVETELVLYPREGHGLREEKHLLDRLSRIVAWYDKYLRPATGSTQQ